MKPLISGGQIPTITALELDGEITKRLPDDSSDNPLPNSD